MTERYIGESPFDQPDLSVSTPSKERKALDLVIQASRADPKLREAVLEVEKWIKRLIESVSEAYQRVDEAEADADRDVDYQVDLRRGLETALRQIAGDRCCQIIYGNREQGWTCLDEQYRALVQPDSYSQELGDALRSGAKRCAVCIARAALGLGGRDAS